MRCLCDEPPRVYLIPTHVASQNIRVLGDELSTIFTGSNVIPYARPRRFTTDSGGTHRVSIFDVTGLCLLQVNVHVFFVFINFIMVAAEFGRQTEFIEAFQVADYTSFAFFSYHFFSLQRLLFFI